MSEPHILLSLARFATATLAGSIGLLALRAHAHTHQRSVLALSAGAMLLSLGYLLEGLLVEVVGWSVAEATTLESITTFLAVALLVASLYVKNAQQASRTPTPRPGPTAGGPR